MGRTSEECEFGNWSVQITAISHFSVLVQIQILPEGEIVQVVIENCGQNTTWKIEGPDARFVGHGDLHVGRIDDFCIKRDLTTLEVEISAYSDVVCSHRMYIFPTDEAKAAFQDGTATLYPIVIVIIFVFTATVFCGYDLIVSRRQSKTQTAANRSGAIVQELFPGNVATQLFLPTAEGADMDTADKLGGPAQRNHTIAELHPSASVLFADVSGFTAWASQREPHQVFTLLEAVFQTFDKLTKRYGVFKVRRNKHHGRFSGLRYFLFPPTAGGNNRYVNRLQLHAFF